MGAYHNTRKTEYRQPYGAVKVGETISLSLDVFDGVETECTCRLWVDGKGETLVPMERKAIGAGIRFSCAVALAEPGILWYSFILNSQGTARRYGALAGRVGGEGRLYEEEPPSFQITVYKERKIPDWYKKAIVYQIFPDRFARGTDFRQRAEKALSAERKGPKRVLCKDWYAKPQYEKDENGRIQTWDFYGGTLSGIEERLSYLKELGVTALYLNPIFQGASNHRYDTGDYLMIDMLLGENEDFRKLCDAAADMGISIILDGVFNHTGCDSRYFNKYGNYPEAGAFQRADSPYREWYRIKDGAYSSWWGVDDLPEVNENNPSYREFIYGGDDSVVRRWLREGGRGWRLDVADELPDDFIAELKGAMLETKEDSILIGEVWEDASNKISYGKLRRYLLGEELDSVMNYPLRDAFLDFIAGKASGEDLCENLESLRENYPPEAFYATLNLMGSHDRVRLLTVLGNAPSEASLSEEERVNYELSTAQRDLAKARLWLVVLCQMTLPGVPCIYYGDEAGLEGYSDPCNRAGFPWGREDRDVETIYRNAISLRKSFGFFTEGSLELFYSGADVFGFTRLGEDGEGAVVLVNKSISETHTVRFPLRGEKCFELTSGQRIERYGENAEITLPPLGSAVVYFTDKPGFGKSFERGSGVLCHVTSLPKEGGRGTFGKPAEKFVDFLQAAGQKYWQILPLNPTDPYGSPYAGISAFAGNTALLDTEGKALRQLFESHTQKEEFLNFCHKNQKWLDKYAVFMALQNRFCGLKWQKWPKEYRRYNPELKEEPTLREEVLYHKYGQFEFFRQWQKLRRYAREKGIRIIGDLPIYVSEDSADVWANQEKFCLDTAGYKREEAGVPPDYFSAQGQLWGNPLYDWGVMEKNGYTWWIHRLAWAFKLYDYMRLDHFRGFESFWAVPKGKKATEGRWLYGPGAVLFEMAEKELGSLPVLAEDLGSITPGVRALAAKCGFVGTEVMQFYDGDPRKGYVPPEGKAVYTGTHDNQTLLSWCKDRYPEEEPEKMAAELMLRAMESSADLVILPLQDVLGLDATARMNTPGTVEENWMWQAEPADFDGAAKRLSELTKCTGRS